MELYCWNNVSFFYHWELCARRISEGGTLFFHMKYISNYMYYNSIFTSQWGVYLEPG